MEEKKELMEKEGRQGSFMREWGWYLFGLLVFMVVCIILFKGVFCLAFTVGESMEPTLRQGDALLLQRMGYQPDYGDIVLVRTPGEGHNQLVKRVIGMPGDTIDIDPELGVVYRNGVALEEPYIAEPTRVVGDIDLPITLDDGHYFVMGDNRNHSRDSRFVSVGAVDRSQILCGLLVRLNDLSKVE